MRDARSGATAHTSGRLRWSAGRGLAECGACGYLGGGMSGGCRHSDVIQACSVRCGHRPRGWGLGRVSGGVRVGRVYASCGRRAGWPRKGGKRSVIQKDKGLDTQGAPTTQPPKKRLHRDHSHRARHLRSPHYRARISDVSPDKRARHRHHSSMTTRNNRKKVTVRAQAPATRKKKLRPGEHCALGGISQAGRRAHASNPQQ